jgi:hypothetical protein
MIFLMKNKLDFIKLLSRESFQVQTILNWNKAGGHAAGKAREPPALAGVGLILSGD